jgi:hypothetical protein
VPVWTAKVYVLAILIAFFSGAWPYVKLGVMLACWVCPSGVLSTSRREQMLKMMDALGKWSLIDFFVMVMMMCAFKFNMALGENLIINVTVVPHFGFYLFLLATMVSLGIGHIVLACHRLILDEKNHVVVDVDCTKEAIVEHVFAIDTRLISPVLLATRGYRTGQTGQTGQSIDETKNDSDEVIPEVLVRATKYGTGFLVFGLVVTAVFLLLGTILETFRFEFLGLTGILLKDKSTVDYSFVSVGETVPLASGKPNDVAVRWMEASYFAFGLGMPMGMLAAVTFMWLVPLSLKHQRLVLVVAEVLNAWSALDVFLGSICGALLEIQQVRTILLALLRLFLITF